MKKFGIITFHRAINYGAILQAIALQRAIEQMGYDVELIDYVDCLYDHYKISYKTNNILKTCLKFVMSGKIRLKNKRFQKFLQENGVLSQTVYDRENIREIAQNDYKAFITGSDQVFNPKIVDYDATYLLDFVKEKKKCNSYAASIGMDTLSVKEGKWLKKHIENFNMLCVREKTAQAILESFGIGRSVLVVDPTLLITREMWRGLEHKVSVPKHYILYYGFSHNEYIEQGIEELAQKEDLPICVVSDKLLYKKKHRVYLGGIGPAEWLYLIDHAEYIFTNSFHGMVFSFIFNKNVWVSDSNDGTFSRMRDFLNELNCDNRILAANVKINLSQNIQYEKVKLLMEKKIMDSKNKLMEIIK